MTAASLRDVSKSYGSHRALQGMSFELPKGSVCALVGPNGSGKTTTMGILGGLLKHQTGQVDILGQGPFDAERHAGQVSLMPQDCTPSPYMSLRKILMFYGQLQGLSNGLEEEVDQRLKQVELHDRASSKYGQLSHGMRRRFSVAQALLGSPQLILLDEPTSGLDPELVVQIRDLIAAQRGKATLLVSSHILSELEALCDYVVFIDGGKCVRQGTMREVTSGGNVVRYILSSHLSRQDYDELELLLQGCTLGYQEPVLTVAAPQSQTVEETNRLCLPALLERDLQILEVRAGDTLEQTYLRTRNAKLASAPAQVGGN